MAEYLVIDDVEGLRAAAELLAAGSGPVAVDVERASGFRYSQRAYLVQVFRRGAGGFLFDPPAIGDFTALQAAIGDVEWVLHAASQDLPSLREIDLLPPSIFDTELASRLLGRERVGLGAVVEETLGITLAKAHSASDWSTRPLPQAWLEYAALDVEHLIDVRDVLAADLVEQGKVDLRRRGVRGGPNPHPQARPAPTRGAGSAACTRCAVVEPWPWRVPCGSPARNSPAPRTWHPAASCPTGLSSPRCSPTRRPKQDLARVKEFNGRASRTQLDRWWAAFEEGRAATDLPPERGTGGDSLPPPRAWADRNPAADKRLKAARPVVEAHAEQLAMPTENLLTPELLRRVAWNPPEPVTADGVGAALADLGARPWQIAQTAQMIADAFVESVQAAPEALEPPFVGFRHPIPGPVTALLGFRHTNFLEAEWPRSRTSSSSMACAHRSGAPAKRACTGTRDRMTWPSRRPSDSWSATPACRRSASTMSPSRRRRRPATRDSPSAAASRFSRVSPRPCPASRSTACARAR